MMLTTFTVKGITHLGALDGAMLVSLGHASSADPRFGSMLDLVRAGGDVLADVDELVASHPASAAYAVDDVTLLAPLPNPPRIRARLGGELVDLDATTVPGPGALVRVARGGGLDRLGLAAVVGPDPADPADHAGREVFGYTILGPAQGPCLVTADTLPPSYQPAVRVRVNGATWRDERSATIRDDLATAVADLGRGSRLVAGELVAAPLLSEPGSAGDDPRLKDGDEIEVEVDGIGLLRNRIHTTH